MNRLSFKAFPSLTSLASLVALASAFSAAPALAGLSSYPLGNGEGYAGAPPSMAYYRLDPGFRCAPGSAGPEAPGYRSAIDFTGRIEDGNWIPQARLYDPCSDTYETIADPSRIERTYSYVVFESYAFFEGGIYEKRYSPPHPGERIERKWAWCRTADASQDFGLDVMVSDREAEIWISEPTGSADPSNRRNVRWVRPFAIDIRGGFVSADGFALAIGDASAPERPDPAPGLTFGQMRAEIDGQSMIVDLQCRLETR